MKNVFIWFISVVAFMAFPQVALTAPFSLVQIIRVENVGTKGAETASFVIPGIGQGELRCQQRATWIKFRPYNRNRETNFWSSKYEMKRGQWSVAAKNARVYRYAHAHDSGRGGTGSTAREGLNKYFNQKRGVENDAQGYLHGVFSQRLGRHQSIGRYTPPPSTQVYLTWYWKDMRKGKKRSKCFMKATMVTPMNQTVISQAKKQVKKDRIRYFKSGRKFYGFGNSASIKRTSSWSLDLNWHGQEDTAPKSKVFTIKELGQVRLQCDSEDSVIEIAPTSPSAGAYVIQVEGEGYEAEEKSQYFYDPLISSISPIPLPVNGMLRVGLQVDDRKYQLNISHIQKINDETPALNFCETSVNVTER